MKTFILGFALLILTLWFGDLLKSNQIGAAIILSLGLITSGALVMIGESWKNSSGKSPGDKQRR